jgi:nitrite reductase/ring-hydroxylating ferredoxin subunit
VLTDSGRLVCPWHGIYPLVTELIIGACFKVQTGDIEEAPAWDALPCFKTSIEGDEVSVEINNLGIPLLPYTNKKMM